MLDGDLAPPFQKGHSPQFFPISVVAKRLDGLRCHCDIVLDGDSAPPHNLRPICCGLTAGWMMKMPLGRDVGLGPGDIMLDGDPVPHKRGTAPPPTLFGPWPNDWMDEDASWYGGRPRPVLYGDLSTPEMGT